VFSHEILPASVYLAPLRAGVVTSGFVGGHETGGNLPGTCVDTAGDSECDQ